MLTAGDLDEAVSGLLTNHMVASDADGTTVPAGFTRIAAFRGGVGGNMDACYSRYTRLDDQNFRRHRAPT